MNRPVPPLSLLELTDLSDFGTLRINLPAATSGWLLRVTRITPNQNNNKIADIMQIAGFTEVIDAKLRYPNTALLYIEFSAEQFRSIPAVTVETKLRGSLCRPTTTLWLGPTPVSGTVASSWPGLTTQPGSPTTSLSVTASV
ncbi:hypothetical protein M2395_000714 [Pseudomonas sp. BIGb0176]|nr:hypothetical protein [Pseudomonas sp. BIGb0176]